MSKHTPGPWKYRKENGSPTTGQHMIAGAKPGYLAEVRDCGSGDVEANARLIAAAPDLLDALLDVSASLSWNAHGECRAIHNRPIMTSAMAIEKARAAIAKATGEQQ